MQINQVDSIESNGGAVSSKAAGTALVAVGCVTGGAWSLGSSVHTLISAPVLSLLSLGAAGAATGAGAYMMRDELKAKFDKASQAVEAVAA